MSFNNCPKCWDYPCTCNLCVPIDPDLEIIEEQYIDTMCYICGLPILSHENIFECYDEDSQE